jgi:hypothetical protein
MKHLWPTENVNIDVMHNGINNIKIPRYKAINTSTHELQGNNDQQQYLPLY